MAKTRWVTIGGEPDGEGAQHAGGFPVQIDEHGTILKGRGQGGKVREIAKAMRALAGGQTAELRHGDVIPPKAGSADFHARQSQALQAKGFFGDSTRKTASAPVAPPRTVQQAPPQPAPKPPAPKAPDPLAESRRQRELARERLHGSDTRPGPLAPHERLHKESKFSQKALNDLHDGIMRKLTELAARKPGIERHPDYQDAAEIAKRYIKGAWNNWLLDDEVEEHAEAAKQLLRRLPNASVPAKTHRQDGIAMSRKKAKSDGTRWITIGGSHNPETGAKHEGGTPIKIDGDGNVVGGPERLVDWMADRGLKHVSDLGGKPTATQKPAAKPAPSAAKPPDNDDWIKKWAEENLSDDEPAPPQKAAVAPSRSPSPPAKPTPQPAAGPSPQQLNRDWQAFIAQHFRGNREAAATAMEASGAKTVQDFMRRHAGTAPASDQVYAKAMEAFHANPDPEYTDEMRQRVMQARELNDRPKFKYRPQPAEKVARFKADLDSAMSTLKNMNGLYDLYDVRKALPQYGPAEFDTLLWMLRKERYVTLDSFEQHNGTISAEQRAAGINEGRQLQYVSHIDKPEAKEARPSGTDMESRRTGAASVSAPVSTAAPKNLGRRTARAVAQFTDASAPMSQRLDSLATMDTEFLDGIWNNGTLRKYVQDGNNEYMRAFQNAANQFEQSRKTQRDKDDLRYYIDTYEQRSQRLAAGLAEMKRHGKSLVAEFGQPPSIDDAIHVYGEVAPQVVTAMRTQLLGDVKLSAGISTRPWKTSGKSDGVKWYKTDAGDVGRWITIGDDGGRRRLFIEKGTRKILAGGPEWWHGKKMAEAFQRVTAAPRTVEGRKVVVKPLREQLAALEAKLPVGSPSFESGTGGGARRVVLDRIECLEAGRHASGIGHKMTHDEYGACWREARAALNKLHELAKATRLSKKWPETGRWITIHPNGEEDGRRVFIDKSSGEILAGGATAWHGKTLKQAFGKGGGGKAEKPEATAPSNHKEDGHKAGAEGFARSQNPHAVGTDENERWDAGWEAGDEARRQKIADADAAEKAKASSPENRTTHRKAFRDVMGEGYDSRYGDTFERFYDEFDTLPESQKAIHYRSAERRGRSYQNEHGARVAYAGVHAGLTGDGMDNVLRAIRNTSTDADAAEKHDNATSESQPATVPRRTIPESLGNHKDGWDVSGLSRKDAAEVYETLVQKHRELPNGHPLAEMLSRQSSMWSDKSNRYYGSPEIEAASNAFREADGKERSAKEAAEEASKEHHRIVNERVEEEAKRRGVPAGRGGKGLSGDRKYARAIEDAKLIAAKHPDVVAASNRMAEAYEAATDAREARRNAQRDERIVQMRVLGHMMPKVGERIVSTVSGRTFDARVKELRPDGVLLDVLHTEPYSPGAILDNFRTHADAERLDNLMKTTKQALAAEREERDRPKREAEEKAALAAIMFTPGETHGRPMTTKQIFGRNKDQRGGTNWKKLAEAGWISDGRIMVRAGPQDAADIAAINDSSWGTKVPQVEHVLGAANDRYRTPAKVIATRNREHDRADHHVLLETESGRRVIANANHHKTIMRRYPSATVSLTGKDHKGAIVYEADGQVVGLVMPYGGDEGKPTRYMVAGEATATKLSSRPASVRWLTCKPV